MGSGPSLPIERLREYESCTFFTKSEILKIHKSYRELKATLLDGVVSDDNFKIPVATLLSIPELRVNPFGRRICEVFSETGDGCLAFEDFLNMYSIFSQSAPREFKVFYLFRMYDKDNDGFLNRSDLLGVVSAITGGNLHGNEETVVDQLLLEADVDGSGKLSFDEFNKIVSRLPDFASKFVIHHIE